MVAQARAATLSLLGAAEKGTSAPPGSCSLAQLALSPGSGHCGGHLLAPQFRDNEGCVPASPPVPRAPGKEE